MRWQEGPAKTGEREKIAVWLEHDQLKALRALLERDGVPIAEQILFCLSWKWRKRSPVKIKDMLVGHQQEIQAERDRKLEAARQQRKNRRQRSP